MKLYHVVKCTDPATRICIRGGDGRKPTNEEMACVVSRRAGRIRERLLPQFDVGFRGVEFDASEEVFSCPVNPRLGGDAARFECSGFGVEMVDNRVEDLWREGGRHRRLHWSRWALDLTSGQSPESVNRGLASVLYPPLHRPIGDRQ
jgi:hypothetical protein